MRISDWSSDVCSSDLYPKVVFTALTIPVNATDPSDASNGQFSAMKEIEKGFQVADAVSICVLPAIRLARINAINGFPLVVHPVSIGIRIGRLRSEEHTSELQSLMRTSYAVFCLKKKHA